MAFNVFWTPWNEDDYPDLRRRLTEAILNDEEFPGQEILPDNSDKAVGIWREMYALYMTGQAYE